MNEPEILVQRVNDDDWLIHRGRYVETTFLLAIDVAQYLICIHHGRIESVTAGPFVMPRWQFALKTTRMAWEKFCAPRPESGYHDVMALVKYKRLTLEGDLHPFMANLLYFKDVLAHMRGGAQ